MYTFLTKFVLQADCTAISIRAQSSSARETVVQSFEMFDLMLVRAACYSSMVWFYDSNQVPIVLVDSILFDGEFSCICKDALYAFVP